MKQIIDTTKQTQPLYIYRTVMSFKEDSIDDYIFKDEGKWSDDVGYIENRVAYKWEHDVETVQVDLAGLLHYINDGYSLLEHNDRRK